jgi:MYXO-CTERM domain-containing protein
MCTSDTSCVLGEVASLALTVALPVTPEPEEAGPRVAPPYADPNDAEDRSCALQPGTAPRGAAWLLVLGALALVRGRRSRRALAG